MRCYSQLIFNQMEAKFKKGQSVRITKRNGEIIDGIV